MPISNLKSDNITADLWLPVEEVESSALDQLRNSCALPWAFKVSVMPDCLSEDTEVLTDRGWVFISNIDFSYKVANFWPKDSKISFEDVKDIIYREKRFDEKMYLFCGPFSNKAEDKGILVSENHRMAYKIKMGKVAKEIVNSKVKDYIWNGSGLSHYPSPEHSLSLHEILLCCWIVGDGNIKKTKNSLSINKRIRFGLKKERKIKRVIYLLNILNLKYSINISKKQTTIIINTESSAKFIEIVGNKKEIPFNLIFQSQENAKLILEEAIQVDGDYETYIKNGTYRLNSTSENNLDFFSALISINFGIANINKRKKGGSYKPHTKKICSYLSLITEKELNKSKSGKHNKSLLKKEVDYKGKLVCIKCSSGFFIARKNGLTFITGNCHWGNGATVGSVIALNNAISPAAVGVDLACVDKESEYLSPTGWKKIKDYDGGLVMDYDKETGFSKFDKPLKYIKSQHATSLHFKSKYGVDQFVSLNHKMLCWRIEGRKRTRIPIDILAIDFYNQHEKKSQGFKAEFETTFTPIIETSLRITEQALRVQVMVIADGYIDKQKKAIIRLKKKRKIERAEKLLREASMPYTKKLSNDGCTVFKFIPPMIDKDYSNFWKSSLKQLEIISEECLKWDGNEKYKCFYTRIQSSADFIQYVFSATGKRGVLLKNKHKKDGKTDYRVFANHKTKIGIAGSPKSKIEKINNKITDIFYCFTMNKGYWIMRRNGKVVITGNCGMAAIHTNLKASDLPDSLGEIRHSIERTIPVGFNKHGKEKVTGMFRHGEYLKLKTRVLDGFKSVTEKFHDLEQNMLLQCGTLGGGNHFIEICLDQDQRVWIVLHSGSRNIGKMLAEYHINIAKKLTHNTYLPDRDLSVFLEGTAEMKAYTHDLFWAQDYAYLNRLTMMQLIFDNLRHYFPQLQEIERVICHHNYVSRENHFENDVLVTRKGAISAKKGEMGIIPGSMGTRSYIVRGLGNPLSMNSAPHGAGRRMSRGQAKKHFTVKDLVEQTHGVECRKDIEVLDELPGAYKDIDQVIEYSKDLVEVVHTLKQVLCVKG